MPLSRKHFFDYTLFAARGGSAPVASRPQDFSKDGSRWRAQHVTDLQTQMDGSRGWTGRIQRGEITIGSATTNRRAPRRKGRLRQRAGAVLKLGRKKVRVRLIAKTDFPSYCL